MPCRVRSGRAAACAPLPRPRSRRACARRQEADVDNRKRLYEAVMLSGGSTMFPGLPMRLERDVRRLYLDRVLKVALLPPRSLRRAAGPWRTLPAMEAGMGGGRGAEPAHMHVRAATGGSVRRRCPWSPGSCACHAIRASGLVCDVPEHPWHKSRAVQQPTLRPAWARSAAGGPARARARRGRLMPRPARRATRAGWRGCGCASWTRRGASTSCSWAARCWRTSCASGPSSGCRPPSGPRTRAARCSSVAARERAPARSLAGCRRVLYRRGRARR